MYAGPGVPSATEIDTAPSWVMNTRKPAWSSHAPSVPAAASVAAISAITSSRIPSVSVAEIVATHSREP